MRQIQVRYSGCAARETGGASCIYAKLVDDRQNVTSGENQVLFALVLNLGATVAGEHDNVAFLDVYGDAVALLIHAARANGANACFLRLFLRSFGDNQTGCGGLLSLSILITTRSSSGLIAIIGSSGLWIYV